MLFCRCSFQGWKALLAFALGFAHLPNSRAETTVDAEVVGTASDRGSAMRLRVVSRRSIHPTVGYLGGFIETGGQGDRSFDVDRVVIPLGPVWLGRTHPLLNPERRDLDPYSAIGNAWAQNQSDALQPRVVGWIGGGANVAIRPTTTLRLAVSPVFLPSFGTRLNLSATDAATGSYFSRLPPDTVTVNGVALPLRYRLRTGNLRDIVLQPQALLAWSEKTRIGQFTVVGWSAPSPAPAVAADAVLQIQADQIQALATVVPTFARQNFLGFAYDGATRDRRLGYSAQIIYELTRQVPSASASLAYAPARAWRLRLGLLHRFAATGDAATTPVAVVEARRDDRLMTAEVSYGWRSWLVSLFAQRNWAGAESGQWTSFSVRKGVARHVSASLQTSVLSGANGSFFGNWRALDQISLGVTLLW